MSIFTKRLPVAVVAAATLLSSVIPSAAMPLSPAAPTKSQSDIIRVQGVSESGDNQSPLWWRNQISPGGAPGGYDVRAQDLPGNPGPGPVYQPRDDVRRDDWRQRRDWEERRDAERRDLERRDWERRREWDRQRDYERRNDYGFYRGHRGYRDYRPGYRLHDGYWFPLAAFAAGAVIGGAISTPVAPRVAGNVNPKHYQWCSARYRSYDVRSNTFQPNNGPRKQCLSPYY